MPTTSVVDVELYDPISKFTWRGDQTWMEAQIDFVWGQAKWGIDPDQSAEDISHVKYWVHGIRIADAWFAGGGTFQRGQPLLVQTKDETYPGFVDTFARETTGDGFTCTYSFVLIPRNMLDFVAALNGIVTKGKNESKT